MEHQQQARQGSTDNRTDGVPSAGERASQTTGTDEAPAAGEIVAAQTTGTDGTPAAGETGQHRKRD